MLVLIRYYSGYTELNNYVNRLLDEVTFVRCKDTIIIIIVKGVHTENPNPLERYALNQFESKITLSCLLLRLRLSYKSSCRKRSTDSLRDCFGLFFFS